MVRGLASCWTVAVALGGSVPLWAGGLCPLCGELCCGGVWGFVGLEGMCGSVIRCRGVGQKLVMLCAPVVASLQDLRVVLGPVL